MAQIIPRCFIWGAAWAGVCACGVPVYFPSNKTLSLKDKFEQTVLPAVFFFLPPLYNNNNFKRGVKFEIEMIRAARF